MHSHLHDVREQWRADYPWTVGPGAKQNVRDLNVVTGEMGLQFRPPTRTSEKLESVDSEATLEAEERLSTSTVWMTWSPNPGV